MIWILRLLALAALGLNTYLCLYTWDAVGELAGCGGDSGCDKVLSSHWSSCFGIPVLWLALPMYVWLLLLSLRKSPPWRALTFITSTTAGAALWFTAVQAFALQAYCQYCLSIHLLGMAQFMVVLAMAPKKEGKPMLWGLLFVTALAAGQLSYSPDRSRIIQSSGLSMDVSNYPILGSADAPHVLVEFLDYHCHFCTALHPKLMQAMQRYGDQLAVVVIPITLDTNCFPPEGQAIRLPQVCDYARLAYAVWEAEPTKFAEFHNFMKTTRRLNAAMARMKAEELVGKAALEQALTKVREEQRLQQSLALHGQLVGKLMEKSGGNKRMIPKLIINDATILMGPPPNAETLFQHLETQLQIKAVEQQDK